MSLCRNGDIPGTSLLGLDRLKEKPPKPQKKRITPSVPLSSVERLGVCVCVCVRACVCACMHVRVYVCVCMHAYVLDCMCMDMCTSVLLGVTQTSLP